jgi:hypothetical protein
MCWELLLGVLLILWGFSHITESIFNVHIPVFGILFGLFLLYLGVELISGFSHWPQSCNVHCTGTLTSRVTSMGSSHLSIDDSMIAKQDAPWDYKTIMGNSLIDLTHISPGALQVAGAPFTINIDTIFGKTDIILPKDLPTRIIAKCGCAKVTTPDDCSMVFGSHIYNSHTQEQPLLIIYSSTVFGNTVITTAQ